MENPMDVLTVVTVEEPKVKTPPNPNHGANSQQFALAAIENDNTRATPLEGRRLLHEVVQEKIKNYILQNNSQPGDPMPNERELAALFNVSRTSVREAVKSLSALGILESRHGSGLFVRNFTMSNLLDNFAYDLMFSTRDLADLHELRFHIEYGMIARAVRSVTQQQLEDMEVIAELMRKNAEKGIYSGEDDRDFHKALWMNIDNKALNKLLDITFLVRQKTANDIHSDTLGPIFVYHRHRKILEALRRRDLEAMKIAIICHYTLVDSICSFNADSMDADFIRHSIELEMRLLTSQGKTGNGAAKPSNLTSGS